MAPSIAWPVTRAPHTSTIPWFTAATGCRGSSSSARAAAGRAAFTYSVASTMGRVRTAPPIAISDRVAQVSTSS